MPRVISVVAGGWSVSQVPHDLIPGYVIAVNDSAYYLQRRVDEIVSMDRLWTEARQDRWMMPATNVWLRTSAVQNIRKESPDKLKSPWVHVFECDNESFTMVADVEQYYPNTSMPMTNRPYTLNGTNSGMCAINRAYVLKPTELFLFGFDMQFGPRGERHWHPDYPWTYASTNKRLSNWAKQFKGIAKQFEAIGTRVHNINNRSLITVFPVFWLDYLRSLRTAA